MKTQIGTSHGLDCPRENFNLFVLGKHGQVGSVSVFNCQAAALREFARTRLRTRASNMEYKLIASLRFDWFNMTEQA